MFEPEPEPNSRQNKRIWLWKDMRSSVYSQRVLPVVMTQTDTGGEDLDPLLVSAVHLTELFQNKSFK